MSVSILEALQNAEFNLDTYMRKGLDMCFDIAKSQLHNAVTLLNKGYNIWTEIEPLLEKYDYVENVPNNNNK
jgi:hypothetical protein